MSRRRSISTDISTDPKLARVAEEFGALPLLLYTWAIPHASDMGQITSDPLQFRLLVCPALPIKSSDVQQAIDQLITAGMWRLAGEEGHLYLQFPEEAWFRHQSYINASKRPKQQGVAENAKKRQETPEKGVTPSPSPSLTPTPTPTLSPSPSKQQQEAPDVVAALTSFNVQTEKAQELARTFPSEQILQQIDWLPYRKPRENPGALLCSAITGNYPEPPGATKGVQQRREAERRERDAATLAAASAQKNEDRQRQQAAYDAMFQGYPEPEKIRILDETRGEFLRKYPAHRIHVERGEPVAKGVSSLWREVRNTVIDSSVGAMATT